MKSSGLFFILFLFLTGTGFVRPAAAAEKLSVLTLPDLEGFRAEPYIEMAARLQKLGKAEIVATLKRFAKEEERKHNTGSNDPAFVYDSSDWRTVILCRMLFVPRAGGKVLYLPANNLIAGTRIEDWPSMPVHVVDGVPFVVTLYCDSGDESITGWRQEYVSKCVEYFDWTTARYTPKTPAQLAATLDSFLLKDLRLTKELTRDEKAFVFGQIK